MSVLCFNFQCHREDAEEKEKSELSGHKCTRVRDCDFICNAAGECPR